MMMIDCFALIRADTGNAIKIDRGAVAGFSLRMWHCSFAKSMQRSGGQGSIRRMNAFRAPDLLS